jgi:sirohydrochlorin ferrochelatase
MKRAILLVDHGSRRAEAGQFLIQLAELVQRAAGDDFIVCHAHMELEEPSIDAGFDRCVALGAKEVVVHPCFLMSGRHASEDVPELVRRAANRHPTIQWRITEPLGVHPLLAELVLVRCGVDGGQRG